MQCLHYVSRRWLVSVEFRLGCGRTSAWHSLLLQTMFILLSLHDFITFDRVTSLNCGFILTLRALLCLPWDFS